MVHFIRIYFMDALHEYDKQIDALKCLRGAEVVEEDTYGQVLTLQFDSTIGNIGLLFITLDAYKVQGVVTQIEL